MGKGKFNEQSSIDYYKVSKEIISYWNSNNIFEKSISSYKVAKEITSKIKDEAMGQNVL